MFRSSIFFICLLAGAPAFAQTVVSGGPNVPELAVFDDTMIQFMDDHDVPAGQLAVAWQGRLVYSRAFSNNAEHAPNTKTLFRLASVSKPLTSTMIHHAHQEGLLSVDDTIDQYLDLSTLNGGGPADPRLSGVTIRNLLEMLGGFGAPQEYGFDPAFVDRDIEALTHDGFPVLKSQILAYMNDRMLIHEPGTTYAYSNYGYMLLGMILESATGLPYGAYADSVFNPIGMWRSRQARSQQQRLYPNEVRYSSPHFGVSVVDNSGEVLPAEYGSLNYENMAAYGGWVSTANELVRWITRMQDPGFPDAPLSSGSLDLMFGLPQNYPGSYSPGDYFYGSGWQVRDYGAGGRNIWHHGSLPSTSTVVASIRDGFTWAALFNKRFENSSALLSGAFEEVIYPARNQVAQWPSHDLFNSQLTPAPPALDAVAAGSWFDVSHNGEGFTVTFINASTAVVYWFTYDRHGNQRWYFGIAAVEGTRLVVEELLTSSGGRFGPGYNPADVEVTPVGSLVLNFYAEGRAKADYLLGTDSGYMDLVRLSQPFESANPANAGDWRNALLFDPSHDGEGYVVEALPNGRVVVYWFTYDNSGNQAWMIGTVVGDFDNGVALPMDRPVGGNFGAGFDPDLVSVSGNGTANMTIQCGGEMSVSYSGGSGAFPAVNLNLQVLGGYVAPPCN